MFLYLRLLAPLFCCFWYACVVLRCCVWFCSCHPILALVLRCSIWHAATSFGIALVAIVVMLVFIAVFVHSRAPFNNGDCSFIQFVCWVRLFVCFLVYLFACLLVCLFSVRSFVSLFVRNIFLLGSSLICFIQSFCLFVLLVSFVWFGWLFGLVISLFVWLFILY